MAAWKSACGFLVRCGMSSKRCHFGVPLLELVGALVHGFQHFFYKHSLAVRCVWPESSQASHVWPVCEQEVVR